MLQALILASQPSGDEIVDKKNECIKNSLAGIIFLGTPHGGSGFSILARIYCVFHYWDGARTTLISYLDLNSEKAQDLENSFALYRQSVRTIDYYESIPDSFLGYYTKPVRTSDPFNCQCYPQRLTSPCSHLGCDQGCGHSTGMPLSASGC